MVGCRSAHRLSEQRTAPTLEQVATAHGITVEQAAESVAKVGEPRWEWGGREPGLRRFQDFLDEKARKGEL